MQLTGCSSMPWLLKIIWVSTLEVMMPYRVMLYSIDNCNLAQHTVELKKWRFLQMTLRMQLTDYCSPLFSKTVYDFFLTFFFWKRMYFWGAMQKPRKRSRPKSFCWFWEGVSWMQWTGYSSNPRELQLFTEAYYAFLQRNIISGRLPTCKQTIWCEWIEDPSSAFKDSVDGQFQQSLWAPTFFRDSPCLLTT